MKQHTKLLLGFALGVTLGLIGFYYFPIKEFTIMNRVTEVFTFVGATFLRMIFMVVVPLILAALMLGAMELGRGAGLGRDGLAAGVAAASVPPLADPDRTDLGARPLSAD